MFTLPAHAQNTLGGHFGVVLPIASVTNSEVTTLSDNFVAGFPFGLTAWLNHETAFDMEVVPFIDDTSVANVLIHPGFLKSTSGGFTLGIRAAFETGGAVGFTPLINKGIPLESGGAVFIELVVPFRWYQEAAAFVGDPSETLQTMGVGIHTGIGF